ncbi:MAG: hypothetical protein FH756_06045 [Firmicutes bacterium]|nr:hypothetical protein [Bacillota bacterium]
MNYQILGLVFDIVGVTMLAFGGVFPIKKLTWDDLEHKSKRVKREVIIARIGLIFALAGFALQIYGLS